ncbi:MAG: hypothetical protein CMP59_06675 [Flavobacteriales bacterium]|nr:hypothetical protein [Flavobacteriales bacterium]|tara:strand:- start:2373 stop:2615 length:243 start_codon:yes stop_codon:yes gene_type:complete
MSQIDTLRNSLIDRLLRIENVNILKAIDTILEESKVSDKPYQLTKEQIEMLKMSEDDIANGRLKSHDDLMKEAREWLKEK